MLHGKCALVTGAGSGIGLAVTKALAQEDVRVAMVARNPDKLSRAAEQIQGAVTYACDLAEPDAPSRAMAFAQEQLGGIDIVFNNAGVITTGTIEEIDIDIVARMIRINVEAAFRLAYLSARLFKKQGTGTLINTTSVLGQRVRPLAGAYAGTKFALEALTEALRLELSGTDVQVLAIAPGLVTTGLHRDAKVKPATALGIDEPLTPEDVARSVLFMLRQPDAVHIARLLILPRR